MKRPEKIKATFLSEIDKHLNDLITGKVETMFEIYKFADLLHIHPIHLSTTIKSYTGKSACYFYQTKILESAKILLVNTDKPIQDIAYLLTYDPSNFTKAFKRVTGMTPKQFREQNT